MAKSKDADTTSQGTTPAAGDDTVKPENDTPPAANADQGGDQGNTPDPAKDDANADPGKDDKPKAGGKGGGKKDKVAALRIFAKRDRFFRAGLKFTSQERVIPKAELEGKITALKNEPMLVVREEEVSADELTG